MTCHCGQPMRLDGRQWVCDCGTFFDQAAPAVLRFQPEYHCGRCGGWHQTGDSCGGGAFHG